MLPRNVLVSNGRFAVALDDKARIRDVYFPYVGLENHAVGHQFRFGVWVDGKFEWLDNDWDIAMTYLPETLTSRYRIRKQLTESRWKSTMPSTTPKTFSYAK